MARLILATAIIAGACSARAEDDPMPYVQPVYGVARGVGTLSTPTPQPTATPAPTATPVPTGIEPLHANACYAAAAVYPWDQAEVRYIIDRESGGDPWAVNPSSGACGCAQLLPCVGLGDPAANLAAAYEKWLDGGQSFWRHWFQWW